MSKVWFKQRKQGVLSWVLAACVAVGLATAGWAANVPLDENLVALFSDLHVTANTNSPYQREGVAQCVREVLALNPRPAHVLMYGDLSFLQGETNDYLVLKELVKPLEAAGIQWHTCLGNHDRREAFSSVFPERAEASLVPGRLVSVVSTPHVDFILLDSCLEGPVRGALDDAQRAWLTQTLARATRPVIVGAHHTLKEIDVANLMVSNAVCVAYIQGHHHAWLHQPQQGVETLCLPSTGHWGDIGYVMANLNAAEAVFTLYQRDYYYPARSTTTPDVIKPEWKERVAKNHGSQWRVPLKPVKR